VGVAMATSGEMGTNVPGTVFAMLGLASTSLYQIWVKTEQKALDLDAWQLLYLQAPLSCVMLLVLTPLVEDVRAMVSTTYAPATLAYLAGSALLAFAVNLSIFVVIRYTSPISYNVLGHSKMCCILLSGAVLFGEEFAPLKMSGVVCALAGIFSYTYLKLRPTKKAD